MQQPVPMSCSHFAMGVPWITPPSWALEDDNVTDTEVVLTCEAARPLQVHVTVKEHQEVAICMTTVYAGKEYHCSLRV